VTAPQAATAVAVTALAVNGAATITATTSAATTKVITALWRRVNPYDHKQVDAFKAQAGRIVVSSQRTVAAAHTASQLMQLRAVGINQNPAVTIPDNVRGQSVTFGAKTPVVHTASDVTVEYQKPTEPTKPVNLGEPETVDRAVTKSDAAPDQIFERAAETYRYQKSVGSDDLQAQSAAEKRIESIVDNNLILAQRLAEQQTLSAVRDLDKRVHGYRRVIHPELAKGGVCGMCVAAASRRYYISELKPIHDGCNCSIAPITDENDIGDLLNYDDLSKLYDQAGSTYNRDLKKTRYELVDHNELGPVLTRINGEKVPYYSTERPAPLPKPAESKADVAKRLLPGLETSLADLRAKGLDESSPQITYHLSQIARLRGELTSA
jgi:hypothetical protein